MADFNRKYYEFTEYRSPDGQTYRFRSFDKFLMSETGYGMPAISYISQRGPNQHGETIYDYRLEPRTIQIVHDRTNCTREDYWDSRSDILNFLRPNRQTIGQFGLGRLLKKLPRGEQRAIDVTIQEGPSFDKAVSGEWDFTNIYDTIRFFAPDPTFYDPTQNCVEFVLAYANHLIFPFSFDGVDMVFASGVISSSIDITYTGTWLSYPSIEVNGPFSGVEIRNETTGEKIRMNYLVSSGETVTITLAYGNKTVTSSTGTNLIGTVTSDSDLATFHIEPEPGASGGINTFSVNATGASVGVSSVEIAYYTRYIGI